NSVAESQAEVEEIELNNSVAESQAEVEEIELNNSAAESPGEVEEIELNNSAAESPGEVEEIESNNSAKINPSLVLLDEVGAGTDPAEGSALAIALLQYLSERVRLTVATTHYGELKALKYQDERFENASVEFDDQSLQPTYRLLWGIPGRSNALTIAYRLGLNQEIVESAKSRVGGLNQDVNEVISGLEAQRREQENKAKEASQLLKKAETFYEEVSQRANSLQQREKDLKLSQEKAVGDAIAAAKAEIAQVIRELQRGTQTAQKAQKATDALNKIAETRIPKPEKPKQKPNYRPQVGERVKIPRLNQTAEIIAVPDNNEQVTVKFGLMKMTLPIYDLESLDGQKVEKPKAQKTEPVNPQATTNSTKPTVRTSKNTLDVRGSRVANAEIELDRAIAEAAANGESVLWIIHGKGTGRLREGVQEFLKQHPQVKKFELAAQNEGGSGVTIANLR
ncbi:MAG: Smr/MutS family protein, partial [Oscillatoria sp. PMC 1068.18]|nr:Smr/MutS family protein [Oscillatoria sp. PMC 1068.18]